MTVRVIITGDRHWRCPALARRVIAGLVDRHGLSHLTIVHGAAPGVDTSFAVEARDAGVEEEAHPARWETAGPSAGPRRNQEMVDSGAALVIACHRDLANSKGTKDCCRRALAAGIPVWLVESEEGTPRRITDLKEVSRT